MKDRSKVLFGFVMLLMVVGILGFSYAIFTTKVEKKGALNIVAGTVTCPIQIEGIEGNQIELVNQTEKEIEVTIRNDSQVPIHSTITYSKNENVEVLASSSNGDSIDKKNLSVGETRTYTIKLINKTNTTQTVTLNGRCGLSNKTLAIADTEEEITGNYERVEPNEPELVTGLIPVVYDESQSSWVKADTTKKWYNYDKQEWANAVTIGLDEDGVGTKKRESYQTAEAGTKISMDDINTMWVWIPRYSYTIASEDGINYYGKKIGDISIDPTLELPGEIDIKFIKSNENDEGTAKYIVSEGDAREWRTPDGFNFGDKQLEGFWYGKFEPSAKENCTVEDYASGGGCDKDTFTPQIKPSAFSWRSIRTSTAFSVAQKMKANQTEYGFGEGIDTHLSKDSEWGAVAYLSQSKYGKYGNDGEEVYINNCSQYITGIAGDTADAGSSANTCNTNTYETLKGQKASTTGNITGVYDMNGGAYEYVMGAFTNGSGSPRSGFNVYHNSGFNGLLNDGRSVSNGRALPEAKYYNLYTSTNSAIACDGGICYGHALSETAGWYNDEKDFLSSDYPWFLRSGRYDSKTSSGVFAFTSHAGNARVYQSFRIALISTE